MKKINSLILSVNIILLFILHSGCKNGENSSYYYDLKCVIVSMEKNGTYTPSGEPVRTLPNKSALIYAPRIHLYTEISSGNMGNIVTDGWWYNHKVGDTIFFKHILRSRFFPINR